MSEQKYVYFLKPKNMDGPIKIGCSDAPINRLMTFAVWSPFPLELIGSVPGKYQDEQFLHQCFYDVHSHLEWFHSTPLLREIVAKIIAGGSVDVVREIIAPKGSVRKKAHRYYSDAKRCYMSYSARVRNATRRLRIDTVEQIIIHDEPNEIRIILEMMQDQDRIPSAAERARLDQFLANVSSEVTPRIIHRIDPKRAA